MKCRFNFPLFSLSSCLCLHRTRWTPAAALTQSKRSPPPSPVSPLHLLKTDCAANSDRNIVPRRTTKLSERAGVE